SKVLPDIKLEQDAMDDSLIKTAKEFLPSGVTFFKNYGKLGKGLTRLKLAREKGIDYSFMMLREADKFNKVTAVHAMTEMFFNGDFEGYSKDMVDKMSPQEKVDTLRRVVKQAVDLTLTASPTKDKTPIEKMKMSKLFVNYWTDRRSRLNTIKAQIAKT